MKNHHFKFAIVSLVLWTALSGCARKIEEEKPNAKADENIVTLTKANLEHVEIKTEAVARGTLSTTLRAPGRVSANLNKTAKVVATLEGRVNLVAVEGRDLSAAEANGLLLERSPHPGLRPHPALPADTRLWAALQQVSGGAWGGAVYDVDRIIERLETGSERVPVRSKPDG